MQTVTSRDGTTIAFDQVGDGPTIILVGGALGVRAYPMYTELAKLLSSHFTAINYDRRGRGDSGDTAPYAVEREIEDLEALIDAAGGSAFVYGASSGAVLALKAAARLGDKVKKLALYEPPFTAGEEDQESFRAYARQTDELLEKGKRGDAVALFLADLMPAEMLEEMRQSPEWSAMEALAPTLAYDNMVMGDDGSVPTDDAEAVRVPTLVLDGGGNLAVTPDAMDALVKALPHAQHRTLEGQEHDVSPEAVAPVLTEFFQARD